MGWLSSPKARLGLAFNGLYLLSLFTSPHDYHSRTHGSPYQYGPGPAPRVSQRPYIPLPPPSGPSKAVVHYAKGSDHLDVTLSNDLTLVRRLDRTLLLSPILSARASNPEPPRNILLRFVAFSQRQFLSGETRLSVTADGVEMWDSERPFGPLHHMPQSGRVLYSSASDDRGNIIETLGHEMPYELFTLIISSKQVVVSLGNDSVELTADQIEALRDMHRRLPQPPPTPEADGTRRR